MPEVVVAQPEATLTPPPPAAQPRRYEIPVLGDEKPAEPEKAAEVPAAPAPEVATDQKPETQEAPAEPEDKPEEVTPEQAAKREGRRFERKLDKAYKARAEAQAEAELLRKQIADLQKPQAPQGEPKLEDFDYDPEKYATAKAEYAKSQAEKEREVKQRTDSEKQHRTKLLTDWEEKAERGADKYPDWQEKVGDLQPDTPVIAAIMEAENGHDIAHHLANNPKEARRIAGLPLVSAIREIGKLEAKLLSKPVEPKTPSKAPAPITPLTGNATAASNEPSENDDMKAWMVKRQKQVHGKR